MTYSGHLNEKNFVGLTITDDWIACGSETNCLYGYHKDSRSPVAMFNFPTTAPMSVSISNIVCFYIFPTDTNMGPGTWCTAVCELHLLETKHKNNPCSEQQRCHKSLTIGFLKRTSMDWNVPCMIKKFVTLIRLGYSCTVPKTWRIRRL